MSKKVLIIDDNPSLTDLYRERFELDGFEVLSAFDGKVGLELAQSAKPDCIILDLMLPGIPGEKVLVELRNDETTKDIPVVITTAFIKNDQEIDSLKKLANDFVMKTDITPNKLSEMVKKLIA